MRRLSEAIRSALGEDDETAQAWIAEARRLEATTEELTTALVDLLDREVISGWRERERIGALAARAQPETTPGALDIGEAAERRHEMRADAERGAALELEEEQDKS